MSTSSFGAFVEPAPPTPPTYLRSFAVKKRHLTLVVPVEQILWLESTGNYVKLHLEEAEHLIRCTMSILERDLDPSSFFRIQRRRIVNLGQLDATRYLGDHRYRFDLRDGRSIRSGRSYKRAVARLLATLDDSAVG